MNCKNCTHPINAEANYCEKCGGKIVLSRINVKSLLTQAASNIFGWDNRYFATIRGLLTKPGKTLYAYIDGTRNRYMNPFSFLLIGLTLCVFVFKFYSQDYLAISEEANKQQLVWMADTFGGIYADEAYQKQSLELNSKMQNFILKYFNLVSFLLIPVYTLFTWLIFRKPFNYGEHLVINSYLQGVGFHFTTIFFLLTVFVHPSFFLVASLGTFTLYCISLKQLYKLSWAELILKILLFIGLGILTVIVLGVLLFIGGFLFGKYF